MHKSTRGAARYNPETLERRTLLAAPLVSFAPLAPAPPTVLWQPIQISASAIANDPALANMVAFDLLVTTTDDWLSAGLRVVLPAGSMFYNHPLGGETAPNPAQVATNPALGFDTFISGPGGFASPPTIFGPFPEAPAPAVFSSTEVSVSWGDLLSSPAGQYQIARLTFSRTALSGANLVEDTSRTSQRVPPTSIARATIPEIFTSDTAAENAGTRSLTVFMAEVSATDVTVPYTVIGTATSGSDFTLTPNPLVITAGSTQGVINLNIIDDLSDELSETVIVTLGNPTGGSAAGAILHHATITDNDPPPTVSFSVAAQNAQENTGTVQITAQLLAPSAFEITLPFSVTGSAANPADYSIDASPLVIPAGQASGSINVTIVDDVLDELDETVIVTMGTPTNASLGATTVHTLTILDNDSAPTIQFTAASQNSPEIAGDLTVTAQISAVSALDVTLPFTLSGTAEPGNDFTITASPIVIPAGQTSGSITITVVGDVLDEDDETVIVTMGTPTNATTGATSIHTLTIQDNDPTPTIAFTAAAQSASEAVGIVTMTAQLSDISGRDVTFPFTLSGTAQNTADYTITASPLIIPAGQSGGSISITVVDDTRDENDETVIVTMGAPTNASLGATTIHTLTIQDNDATPTIQFSVASQDASEGAGEVTITAELSAISGLDVTLPFTVGGTATASADYTIIGSPLVIPAGQSGGSITVTVVDDALDENDETVVVTLGAPTNAGLGATTVHTLTIQDNDPTPTIQFALASQSVSEGIGIVTLTAQLSAISGLDVTLPFTVTGTATIADDYTISTSPIVISAGQQSGSITITVVNDAIHEPEETVIVTMGAPTNAQTAAPSEFTLTILDNDPLPEHTGSLFHFATKPHRVEFTFTADVGASLTTSDLSLINVTTGIPIATVDMTVSYNALTNTAIFTFPGIPSEILADGNYEAVILASDLTDPAGNPLAADVLFEFFFLTGDANHDRIVNLQDFNILAANFGGQPRDFTQGDFNYDTLVNLQDFNRLAGKFGVELLPPPSIAFGDAAPPRSRMIDQVDDEPETSSAERLDI